MPRHVTDDVTTAVWAPASTSEQFAYSSHSHLINSGVIDDLSFFLGQPRKKICTLENCKMILPDSIDDWIVGFGTVIHAGVSMMTLDNSLRNDHVSFVVIIQFNDSNPSLKCSFTMSQFLYLGIYVVIFIL